MSTPEIEIVKGDGKFELIKAVVECASGVIPKKRNPFKFTLKGPLWVFEEGFGRLPRVKYETVVTIDINTCLVGFHSIGGGGEDWILTGGISRDDLRVMIPEKAELLRSLELFEATYNMRTRDGHIKPFSPH